MRHQHPRPAGISRAALYRSYPHLKAEFEQQLARLRDSGQAPDPRENQITRLKARNAELEQRILQQDSELGDLRRFKTHAISRLAAQHDEISRLRAAARTSGASVLDLARRRAAGIHDQKA